MADQQRWPTTLAGDRLRRKVSKRLEIRRRVKLLALSALAAAPVAASLVWTVPTLFVWNASASVPVGLYSISRNSAVRSGDMVVVWIPGNERSLAASRRYVPANVPLVKRVAAAQGDRLCASGPDIRINGRLVATRLKRDPSGRPMPWWTGCPALGPGDVFLLTDSRLSFDGRYFGVTRKKDIVGRAQLLWAL